MQIIKLPIPEPALLIKDFFTEREKQSIVKELEFLCYDYKLMSPGNTGSAINPDTNQLMKSNNGIFLDNVYNVREVSDILSITRKYFAPDVAKAIEAQDPAFKYLSRSNFDSTLLSYYESNDYYEAHEDQAILTIITYYWKEPKQFTGGNLTFTDYDCTVEVEPWDVIIFSSFIKHQVDQVSILPGVKKNELNGRVALSTFVNNRGV